MWVNKTCGHKCTLKWSNCFDLRWSPSLLMSYILLHILVLHVSNGSSILNSISNPYAWPETSHGYKPTCMASTLYMFDKRNVSCICPCQINKQIKLHEIKYLIYHVKQLHRPGTVLWNLTYAIHIRRLIDIFAILLQWWYNAVQDMAH